MAKKHLSLFWDYLNDNLISQFDELNLKIGNQLKEGMIDPELEAELKIKANKLQDKLYHLSSLISLAANYNQKFVEVGRAQLKLIGQLESTMAKIKEQEPNSPIIGNYKELLDKQQQPLAIYNSVDYLRSLPNRKKKAKNYKQGIPTFTNFWPFVKLQGFLEELRTLSNEIE